MREYAPHEDVSRRPRTATISKTPPDLVSSTPARSSPAQQPRSLPHLGGGNHAAADAHRRGDALLRSLSGTFPYGRVARSRTAAGSAETLVRAGILQPRAEFAFGGEANRRGACRKISAHARSGARASGNWCVHRGGGAQYRVRRAVGGA